MLNGKIFFIINFFLYLSILNYSTYIINVHDCSNMAIEQYNFLKSIGIDDVLICCGDYSVANHAWLSVHGYEYDSVSLMPMWIYNIGNKPISETRYYDISNQNIEYLPEWTPNYTAYMNCIPMLFILIFINILRIKVIRPVISNANT